MTIETRRSRSGARRGFRFMCSPPRAARRRCVALTAAIERDFPACFAWLGLALVIDGVDGTLARAARVTETAATIDGVVLDLVVDFLTYVLVPVVALWRSDLMPTPVAFWMGLIVTIASALYFADTRMKTAGSLVSRLSRAVERLRALPLRPAPAVAGERRADARRRRR